MAFPGLFSAVTGRTLPFGYPFYARAPHPTPPAASVHDPSASYTLEASAGARPVHDRLPAGRDSDQFDGPRGRGRPVRRLLLLLRDRGVRGGRPRCPAPGRLRAGPAQQGAGAFRVAAPAGLAGTGGRRLL